MREEWGGSTRQQAHRWSGHGQGRREGGPGTQGLARGRQRACQTGTGQIMSSLPGLPGCRATSGPRPADL